MSKPLLFVSARPLDRAENLRAVWDAYNGEKEFRQVDGCGHHPDIASGKFDTMVIDEFPNETPGRAVMIWHAIQGCKKIGLDQPHPYYRYRYAQLMTCIVTAGTGSVQMFADCTGVRTDRIFPLGLPRTDCYIGKKKGQGATLWHNRRMYLYAPTFRTETETPMPDIDWQWIDNTLTDNETLVVKFHPFRDLQKFNAFQYKHIMSVPSTTPSTPYLIDADVVITDYSSIMLDGYLLGKPCVLFEKNPGYTKTRGMYLQYPDAYCSRYATNEAELIHAIRTADKLTDTENGCLQSLADMCDGHATERTLRLVEQVRKGAID